MIATMYSVRCSKCGGDGAPIVSGAHLKESYCDEWKNSAVSTLERIQSAIHFRIKQSMPGDSLSDRLALPALERLEARQVKIDEAIAILRREILR